MPDDIPTRVAILEQIARSTDTRLGEIRADLHEIRSDHRDIRSEMRSQFRWLLGTILLVLMAQAALWLRVGALHG